MQYRTTAPPQKGESGTLDRSRRSKYTAHNVTACGPIKGEGYAVSKVTITITACIAALVVAAGVVPAQDYGNVVLGGQVVARIRTGGPYGSIAQREAKISQRLTTALSEELASIFDEEIGGPDLDVYQVNGQWTLSIGDTTLIRAYHEDAAPLGISTRELAYQWRENFARRLPRSVPPIKVPQWWREAHPNDVGAIEKKPHGMPDEDLPLVREVAAILEAARTTPDERFEALTPALQQALIERVWSYRHPRCEAPPRRSHIRALSALRRARGLSEEQYAAEKWWMAGLTIKKLREALEMPPGAGPIPGQRPLPDFDAIAAQPEPGEEPEPAQAVTPRPEVQIAEGGPVHRIALATGLDESNQLVNAGRQFAADTTQLLVYLHVTPARPNSIMGVSLETDGTVVARRLVPVAGEKRLAVTFRPSGADAFAGGQYYCRVTLNGQPAGSVPFEIGPGRASVILE